MLTKNAIQLAFLSVLVPFAICAADGQPAGPVQLNEKVRAYEEELHNELISFEKLMSGKSPKEYAEGYRDFRAARRAKAEKYGAEFTKEARKRLEDNMAANTSLDAATIKRRLADFDQRTADRTAFLKGLAAEDEAFMDQLVKTSAGKTVDELRAAILEHDIKQDEKRKAYIESMKMKKNASQ